MLAALQKRLNYHFHDISLLKTALTHRSSPQTNNERLEFLGDALLGQVVAEVLFQQHPDAREGELSRMRSTLVRGERLAMLAKQLDLGACLQLGMGEKKSGGHERRSILSDAFEALIAAIYLDGGMDVCREFIVKVYGCEMQALTANIAEKDAKSALQEWMQANKFPLPVYQASITGEAHAQSFHVTCQVEGLPHCSEGTSTNRRNAEQLAAKHYLELLDD
jgi:ribonuclease III